MKKLPFLFTIAALCISTAAFANVPHTASTDSAQSSTIPHTIRHDMTNYVLTDDAAQFISKPIIVNGKKINARPLQLNGCILVPARAVSNALGFTTTWDAMNYAVTITAPYMKTTQYMGEDLSSAVTTIPGTVGMTAPISWGAPPVLLNNTAYVPVEIFKIIQGNDPKTVSITDTAIEINTVSVP